MAQTPGEAPINPLPPVVVALFLMIVGVEVVFSLGARGIIGGPGAVGWRLLRIPDDMAPPLSAPFRCSDSFPNPPRAAPWPPQCQQ